MRRAYRGGELKVLTDCEVLVERVFLRHIAEVAFELVEMLVKRAVVQDNFAARRLQLAADHFEQRALARTARAHHANELAAINGEGDVLETDFATGEAMRHIGHFE